MTDRIAQMASNDLSMWQAPTVLPASAGEFATALEPHDTASGVRRWFDGSRWSNPYLENWPTHLKAKVQREISPFMVYWRRIE